MNFNTEPERTTVFSIGENNKESLEKTFEIFYYYDDPEFPESKRYVFKFENNKLELHICMPDHKYQ